jgi:competence protein ComEC
LLASADGSLPLHPGQRLASPGLSAEPFAAASRGLQLVVGGRRWLLLPDPQDLWTWQEEQLPLRADGVWLGFRPRARERRWLLEQAPAQVWVSGEASADFPSGWRASGGSGSLQQALG